MNRNRTRCIFFLIALLVIGGFSLSPVLENGFTNWDDNLHVIENKAIQDFSFKNIKTIFTTYIAGNYYPLTMVSYAIEHHFAGLEPFVYHLDSLIMHLLNALLVFWLVYLLSGKIIASFVAAILFVVHPMNVEAVAWVSSRKDVLYCFFYLAALISYVYYLRRSHLKRFYFLTWSFFLLSFLSKPMAATFPFLLFVFDYYYKRKWGKNVFLEKIPFFAVMLILGVIAYNVQIVIEGPKTLADYNCVQRFLFINYGLVAPLLKFILPVKLSNFYPYTPSNDGVLPVLYYFSPVIVLILIFAVIKSLKWTRDILLGALFFLVTILFVLRIFPLGGFIIADRYAYIPYIGLFFLVGQGASVLWEKASKRRRGLRVFLMVALIGVVTAFSFLSRKRIEVWENSMVLWSNAIAQFPELVIAYQSRANAYYYEGDYSRAFKDYEQVLKLNAGYGRAYNGRGKVYSRFEMHDLAIADFSKAIELNADYANAYNNRGAQHYILDENDLSLSDLNKAIELNSELPQAYVNRGKVFVELQKYKLASEDFETAKGLGLDSIGLYEGRGMMYFKSGDLDEAVADFSRVMDRSSADMDVLYYRGTAHAMKGNYDLAIKDFDRVIAINDRYLEAYFNRGGSHKRLGKYIQAIENYSKVILIDPQYVKAYIKRAETYELQNDLGKALNDYRRALTILPDDKNVIKKINDINVKLGQ